MLDQGYQVRATVLHAAQYFVPQNRMVGAPPAAAAAAAYAGLARQVAGWPLPGSLLA